MSCLTTTTLTGLDIFLHNFCSYFVDLEIKGKAFALAKKDKKDLNRAEKIALEGWPKLGNDTRSQIRVKESKEFKVSQFIIGHSKNKITTRNANMDLWISIFSMNFFRTL